MTLQQLIEYLRQHFPSLGVMEIVLMLNSVSDDFCDYTKCVRDTYEVTNTGALYYDAEAYIEINDVAIEDSDGTLHTASRLLNPPVKG